VDPDVLLVDEVLAVGDEAFTHKCLDKFAEFRRRGRTILLVTHSLGLVQRFCDEALWLDHGQVMAVGDPARVIGEYMTSVERSEEVLLAATDAKAAEAAATAPVEEGSALPDHPVETGEAPADMFRATEGRWGSREVEITDVTFVGEDHAPGQVFHSGERVTVRLHVRAEAPVTDFVFGLGIFNADGVCCYGTNTDVEDYRAQSLSGEGYVEFAIDGLHLVEGTYKLDVAVHKRDGYPYDYHRLLHTFRMKSPIKDVGIFRPPHGWSFSPNVKLLPPERR
jgi:lipopolysaccharide transport system ATP-binding protein